MASPSKGPAGPANAWSFSAGFHQPALVKLIGVAEEIESEIPAFTTGAGKGDRQPQIGTPEDITAGGGGAVVSRITRLGSYLAVATVGNTSSPVSAS